MIQSILEGKQKPEKMAELARGRMRSKVPQLTAAWKVRARASPLPAADVVDHLQFLEKTVASLERGSRS